MIDHSSHLPTLLPNHLNELTARGLVENEPVAQFELGDLRNFVYLILDWESREAAWIDPQSDIDTPLEALREHGFQLKMILLTHTHHDHIAGLAELIRRFPNLPVYAHQKDAGRLAHSLRQNVHPTVNGHKITLGKISILIMHTPGHSAGECSFFIMLDRPYIFTGDTVFIRDCGRTDFEGGSNQEMFESIQKVKALPPQTVILPGHHYARECASTVEKELKESPPFKCKTVEELKALP